MSNLNAKQRVFVDEYVVDKNATAAAKRAGYSARTAGSQGSALLQKREIIEAIDERLAEISRKTNITAERVLQEYAAIAFSNPKDYLTKDENGKTVRKHIDDLTDEQAAAINSFSVNDEGETKYTLNNKYGALEALSKHLQLFEDNDDGDEYDGVEIIFKKRAPDAEKEAKTD